MNSMSSHGLPYIPVQQQATSPLTSGYIQNFGMPYQRQTSVPMPVPVSAGSQYTSVYQQAPGTENQYRPSYIQHQGSVNLSYPTTPLFRPQYNVVSPPPQPYSLLGQPLNYNIPPPQLRQIPDLPQSQGSYLYHRPTCSSPLDTSRPPSTQSCVSGQTRPGNSATLQYAMPVASASITHPPPLQSPATQKGSSLEDTFKVKASQCGISISSVDNKYAPGPKNGNTKEPFWKTETEKQCVEAGLVENKSDLFQSKAAARGIKIVDPNAASKDINLTQDGENDNEVDDIGLTEETPLSSLQNSIGSLSDSRNDEELGIKGHRLLRLLAKTRSLSESSIGSYQSESESEYTDNDTDSEQKEMLNITVEKLVSVAIREAISEFVIQKVSKTPEPVKQETVSEDVKMDQVITAEPKVVENHVTVELVKTVEEVVSNNVENENANSVVSDNVENEDAKSVSSGSVKSKASVLNPQSAEFKPREKVRDPLGKPHLSSKLNPSSPEFTPSLPSTSQEDMTDWNDVDAMSYEDALYTEDTLFCEDIVAPWGAFHTGTGKQHHTKGGSAKSHSVKTSSSQTDIRITAEVGSNTKRVKLKDQGVETKSCDCREVCVNTVESYTIEKSDKVICIEQKKDQETMTTKTKTRSMANMTTDDPKEAENKLRKQLLYTQRELLRLRGRVCLDELQKQIDYLEENRERWSYHFSSLSTLQSLDFIMESRIKSLNGEMKILQSKLKHCEDQLDAGDLLQPDVPSFTMSLPVSPAQYVVVNKQKLDQLDLPTTVSEYQEVQSFVTASSHYNTNKTVMEICNEGLQTACTDYCTSTSKTYQTDPHQTVTPVNDSDKITRISTTPESLGSLHQTKSKPNEENVRERDSGTYSSEAQESDNVQAEVHVVRTSYAMVMGEILPAQEMMNMSLGFEPTINKEETFSAVQEVSAADMEHRDNGRAPSPSCLSDPISSHLISVQDSEVSQNFTEVTDALSSKLSEESATTSIPSIAEAVINKRDVIPSDVQRTVIENQLNEVSPTCTCTNLGSETVIPPAQGLSSFNPNLQTTLPDSTINPETKTIQPSGQGLSSFNPPLQSTLQDSVSNTETKTSQPSGYEMSSFLSPLQTTSSDSIKDTFDDNKEDRAVTQLTDRDDMMISKEILSSEDLAVSDRNLPDLPAFSSSACNITSDNDQTSTLYKTSASVQDITMCNLLQSETDIPTTEETSLTEREMGINSIQDASSNNSVEKEQDMAQKSTNNLTEAEQNAVDPKLYESVVNELLKAYPHLAANPQLLGPVAMQQTLVLQMFIVNSASGGGGVSMQLLDGVNTDSKQNPNMANSSQASSDREVKSLQSSAVKQDPGVVNPSKLPPGFSERPDELPNPVKTSGATVKSSGAIDEKPKGLDLFTKSKSPEKRSKLISIPLPCNPLGRQENASVDTGKDRLSGNKTVGTNGTSTSKSSSNLSLSDYIHCSAGQSEDAKEQLHVDGAAKGKDKASLHSLDLNSAKGLQNSNIEIEESKTDFAEKGQENSTWGRNIVQKKDSKDEASCGIATAFVPLAYAKDVAADKIESKNHALSETLSFTVQPCQQSGKGVIEAAKSENTEKGRKRHKSNADLEVISISSSPRTRNTLNETASLSLNESEEARNMQGDNYAGSWVREWLENVKPNTGEPAPKVENAWMNRDKVKAIDPFVPKSTTQPIPSVVKSDPFVPSWMEKGQGAPGSMTVGDLELTMRKEYGGGLDRISPSPEDNKTVSKQSTSTVSKQSSTEEENKDDQEDIEDEWTQVTKKGKKLKTDEVKINTETSTSLSQIVVQQKKTTATAIKAEKERKSNNFERLIAKLQELPKFATYTREGIIEVITTVRKEKGGLSGMTTMDIINAAILVANRPGFEHRGPLGRLNVRQLIHNRPLLSLPQQHKPAMLCTGQADDEEICVICHDGLSAEATKVLECGHVFHTGCIKQWVLGREMTCPTCRRHVLFPEDFPRLGK